MPSSTFNFTARFSPGDTVYAVVPDGGRCAERNWDEFTVSQRLLVYAVVVRPEASGFKISYVAIAPTSVDTLPKGTDWEPYEDNMVFASQREAETAARRKSRENRPNRLFSVEVYGRYTRFWTIAVLAKDINEAKALAAEFAQNGREPPSLQRALAADRDISYDGVDIERVEEIDDPLDADVDCTEE